MAEASFAYGKAALENGHGLLDRVELLAGSETAAKAAGTGYRAADESRGRPVELRADAIEIGSAG